MILSVQTTVSTQAQAQALARAMIEARLAACAQIEPIESVYRWEGAVQQEAEWRISLKTPESAYCALEEALKRLHPYALPMILALPCAHVHPDYAAWVRDNTGV